ncbi:MULTISPECIES: cobalamin biosynthesis protein [Gammaproteobacteria]|uniref:cobalamin biosynthesis protein n=1 Tax=Gammaproteobacteria TaxID=1236 RepID=UPI000DD0B963|nr:MULTISPECIES: cobalamin biosynthesis protein [Gammaproteobacteria]RTE86246.1 hypothetical protein DQX04_06655 [Aliidiomarina sp. B3213]TCZ91597.1 hypothetical protein EYQ95_06665 [Lysobacter sp. N42]
MIDLLGPASAGLFTLWVIAIVVVEWVLPIPTRMHPLWILHQSAKRLAQKVHPNKPRSRSQQRISGLMATVLVWLLIVGSISLFYALADLKQLLGLLLLFFLLGSQPWRQERKVILHAASRKMLKIARARLARWLNRDCSHLTEFGVQKAVFEQSAKNHFHGWAGTLFWFVLLGPIGALNFRVLYELSRAWPQHLPGWHDFGFVATQLFRIFNAPPALLFRAVLTIFAWVTKRRPKKSKWSGSESQLLYGQECSLFSLVAAVTDAPLGGPIKYQGETITRPRWGTQKLRAKENYVAIFRHFALLQITWLIALSPLLLFSDLLLTR